MNIIVKLPSIKEQESYLLKYAIDFHEVLKQKKRTNDPYKINFLTTVNRVLAIDIELAEDTFSQTKFNHFLAGILYEYSQYNDCTFFYSAHLASLLKTLGGNDFIETLEKKNDLAKAAEDLRQRYKEKAEDEKRAAYAEYTKAVAAAKAAYSSKEAKIKEAYSQMLQKINDELSSLDGTITINGI